MFRISFPIHDLGTESGREIPPAGLSPRFCHALRQALGRIVRPYSPPIAPYSESCLLVILGSSLLADKCRWTTRITTAPFDGHGVDRQALDFGASDMVRL